MAAYPFLDLVRQHGIPHSSFFHILYILTSGTPHPSNPLYLSCVSFTISTLHPGPRLKAYHYHAHSSLKILFVPKPVLSWELKILRQYSCEFWSRAIYLTHKAPYWVPHWELFDKQLYRWYLMPQKLSKHQLTL